MTNKKKLLVSVMCGSDNGHQHSFRFLARDQAEADARGPKEAIALVERVNHTNMIWTGTGYKQTQAASEPWIDVDPVKHKKRKSFVSRVGAPSAKETAVHYARWLAARDGIDVTACYDYFVALGEVEGKKRPMSVRFNGVATIEIPNWDHVPVMTEEHDAPCHSESQLANAA